MRYTALFIILSLAVAFGNTEQSQSFLQNQARATDAVDSALDVLKGLKQANVDAQKNADATNRTQEAQMAAEIGELKDSADTNKEAGNAATEHRKFLENKIDVTNQYLKWVIARRKELTKKRKNLSEQRCVSNANFIIALKEHLEGLKVIKGLKKDVVSEVKEQAGIDYQGLAQIDDATKKLSAFAHLFNKKAMDEFMELGKVGNAAEEVNPEYLKWDKDADDNKKGEIKLKKAVYDADKRDVAHKFIDMINALEKHIEESIKNLEENEIQAAVDLSDWLIHTEKELIFLEDEQKSNTNLIDDLTISIVSAKAHEDKLWDIYFNSAATYNDAVTAREKRRAIYMAEKARRLDENLVLDGIIKIFVEQVAILNGKTRKAVDDFSDDGKFNHSQGQNYNDDRVDAKEGKVQNAIDNANKVLG